MKSKKMGSVIAIIIGALLVLSAVIFKDSDLFNEYKSLFGIFVGLGSGTLGGGIGNLISIIIMDSNPELKRKKDIEVNDERNIAIKNKAKAKAFDVVSYLLSLSMLILALMNIDLISILIIIAVYIIIFGVYVYFVNKYSNEN